MRFDNRKVGTKGSYRDTKSIYALLSFLVFLIWSCAKDNPMSPPQQSSNTEEELSPQEVAFLDAKQATPHIDLSEVVLPNGSSADYYLKNLDSSFYDQWLRKPGQFNGGLQELKNLLISKLTAVALYLTDRSKFQYPNEGSDKPAQNGLAYSYGSKDHTVRQKPPAGTCTDKVHGLDCSGFVYQLFKGLGVSIPNGPLNLQRQPNTIKNALKAKFPEWDPLEVKDLGGIPSNQFETGDIIYWTHSDGAAFHGGIILKDINGNLSVFQSNGSPGGTQAECEKNRGLTRGPRLLKLDDPYWFGQPYGIVRIEITNWDIFEMPNQESTSHIFGDIMAADNNAIWIAETDRLFKFDGINWFTYFIDHSVHQNDDIVSVVLGGPQCAWRTHGERSLFVPLASRQLYQDQKNDDNKEIT